MALHRKFDAVLSLRPDVAAIAECAEPHRLRKLSRSSWMESDPVWIGRTATKGLAVFAFNGYRASLSQSFSPNLRYIAPVHINGPVSFNLLAVWAQNASAGITRKHQPGPPRRALTRYREFLSNGPAVVAGDFNSNAIWESPFLEHVRTFGFLIEARCRAVVRAPPRWKKESVGGGWVVEISALPPAPSV